MHIRRLVKEKRYQTNVVASEGNIHLCLFCLFVGMTNVG